MRTILVTLVVVTLWPTLGAAETLATVGKQAITRAEVEEAVRPSLTALENERYKVLKQGLDSLVSQALLQQEAKARGVELEALVKEEIDSKVSAPSDDQIQQVYDTNKQALQNQSLEAVKPRIVEFLKRQGRAVRQAALVEELKAKYPTSVNLRPPVVKVSTEGRPARGGGVEAPVTIVEFSDYECPFCKRAEASVKQVLDTYGDKVRLVYRNYPLPFHSHARPAAEAAHCAIEQGKFWEYHDKLMASTDLSETAIKTLAKDAGLDMKKFDACVSSGSSDAAIEKDIADASDAGVSGTPAFFINGRLLDGAQPFESFKEVIDEEIAWAKQKK